MSEKGTSLPLTLNKTSLDLIVGEESSVTITSGSGNGSYSVKSSDKAVATAVVVGKDSHFTLKAMGKGTAAITVTDKKSGQKASVTVTVTQLCPESNHPHMIDLGLPSGTKWACCNVGSTRPEEYGGNYAWGETEEKDRYNWDNYSHCDGSEETCHDLGRDIAGTKYDVAHVKWGDNWQMPSIDQVRELLDNCKSEWTHLNGVGGRKFTSKINGYSIFLPAGGNWGNYFPGCGYYLSSMQSPSHLNCTGGMFFDPTCAHWIIGFERHQGRKVRPVSR